MAGCGTLYPPYGAKAVSKGGEQSLPILRFGVFDDFKGGATLLLWGDTEGLTELHGVLRSLADRQISVAELNQLCCGRPVDGTRVQLRTARAPDEVMTVRRLAGAAEVEWPLTTERLTEAAKLLEPLMKPGCGTGHQYLPTTGRDALQVIISKGEYGADFRRQDPRKL